MANNDIAGNIYFFERALEFDTEVKKENNESVALAAEMVQLGWLFLIGAIFLLPLVESQYRTIKKREKSDADKDLEIKDATKQEFEKQWGQILFCI